jgi:hypothetical protein
VISQEKFRNNRRFRGGPVGPRFSGTSVGAPSPVQTAAGTVHPLFVQRRGGARKIRASARVCDHNTPGLLPDEAGEMHAKAKVIAVTATTPVTHLIVLASLLNRFLHSGGEVRIGAEVGRAFQSAPDREDERCEGHDQHHRAAGQKRDGESQLLRQYATQK